ncbi:FAD-dependent monooxygenase [Massilia sp. W12]|uniref:oxidoreductase n=1 Tax=Massilia sp. W12 TaxID=3126507 RepID=UPI0030CE9B6B
MSRPLQIACAGAGPAALFAALLLRAQGHRLSIYERNPKAQWEQAGWGVVLPPAWLEECAAHLPQAAAALRPHLQLIQALHIWRQGLGQPAQQDVCQAAPLYAIGRRQLLQVLAQAAQQAGVALHFDAPLLPHNAAQLAPAADLLLAGDGVASPWRQALQIAAAPGPLQQAMPARPKRYVWLGLARALSGFHFVFVQTPHGWLHAHCYPHAARHASVVLEADEALWQAHMAGASSAQWLAFCQHTLADWLQGAALLAQPGAQWQQFHPFVAACWQAQSGQTPLFLLGDAAHQLHFSIGAGTRLAWQDALLLAHTLAQQPSLAAAGAAYAQAGPRQLMRSAHAAHNSLHWFADPPFEADFGAFCYSLLTRSMRVLHSDLQAADAAWFARNQGQVAAPCLQPLALAGLRLANRIVVAPMAQYQARDGRLGTWHQAHLRALLQGGAALVYTEMLGVSLAARITPACLSLQAADLAAWRAVLQTARAAGCALAAQIGHAGAKGACLPPSAGLGYEAPLPPSQAWPLFAASALPWQDGRSASPQALDEAGMQAILDDFVAAARLAAQIGFDLLEIHAAHGYLLSGFLSPLYNQRRDGYGGDVAARCRFPLQVLAAVRAVWRGPLSVRISALDWVAGGNTLDEALQIAALLQAGGADLLSVSSAQVSPHQQVAYGRMYQALPAAQIRRKLGMPVLCAGNIQNMAMADTLLAAGWADLCAIGRPHLQDPAWTRSQAAARGISLPLFSGESA